MASWPQLDDQLLADAAATFHWRLGVPVPLAITRDGAVLFRRTPPRGFASDLHELASDGSLRTLATADDLLGADEEQLSDAERARRERTRTATRGVVDVGVSDDGQTVLVPLGDRLYLIERSETGGGDPDGSAGGAGGRALRGSERSETGGGDPDGSAGGAGGRALRGSERSETGGGDPDGSAGGAGGRALRGSERSETGGGDPDGSAGGAGGRALRGIERSATTSRPRAIDAGGPAYDPHLSPDGTMVAFVRDGDLWVASVGEPPRRLTHHPEGFEYGVADFAAQEELRRTRGFWWAPDSRRIVFQRSDLRRVQTLYVADARHNDRPPVPFRYPRAGTPNAVIDLGVIDARAPGEPRWLTWDRDRHEYLVSVQWPARAPLTALVLDRAQENLALLAFDVDAPPGSGGAITGVPILTEHDDAWLNADVGAPRWLDDGSGFLWMTEASGHWVLELRAAGGALVRVLTRPELGLRELVAIDDGAAIVEASTDPVIQDVWRIPLDRGEPVRLSSGDGVARAAAARHGCVVIDCLLRTGGRRTVAISASGRRELPSAAERPGVTPTTQLETVSLDGRTHHVAITRPRVFDHGRRYPVLLKVYGGPHVVTVEAGRDAYVMDQWYADAGFIVVRVDGRGTPHRGRAWERAVLRDLITVPLDDQIAALQAIRVRHPELDLARVGVFGWSFGGYFSTMAALLRPDVFKAAVAGAPVTDWKLYDTAYTERYMKTPAANPEGYRATSALTHAARLTRPLLVLHGITDDNVHFAHTLALIEALYVAGKRAEVITLSATHMVPDPELAVARERVQVDFFRQHLGPP